MADRETKWANAFETRLTSDMGPLDLVATVATTVGGPASACYLVIEPDSSTQREVVYFDGTFDGTHFRASAVGSRYLTGSAAVGGLTHRAGAKVRMSPLAQHFEDLNDRVEQRLPVYNVKSSLWGAVGDGVTDDTSAIQAALNACGTAGGGVVYFPAGTYRTTSAIESKSSGTIIMGSGLDSSIIDYRGAGGYAVIFGRSDYNPSIPAQSANYRRVKLMDLQVKGTNSTGAAGGIKIHGATRWSMSRVYVHHFASGPGIAFYDYSWVGTLVDPYVEDCERAIWFISHSIDSANQSGNAMLILGGELGAGCTYGVVVGNELAAVEAVPSVGSSIVFLGTTIEGTDSWGAWIVEGNAVRFDKVYFENCGADAGVGTIKIGNAAVRPRVVTIERCFGTGTIGANQAFCQVERVEVLSFTGNKIDVDASGATTTTGLKLVSSSCDRVDIGPNFMGGSVDTFYDYGAAANWVHRRIDVAGTGEDHRSGSNGWTWRAAASYIHKYVNAAGTAVAQLGLGGLLQLAPDAAGHALEVIEGGLGGTVRAWISDAGRAFFNGQVDITDKLSTGGTVSFGNSGTYGSNLTLLAKATAVGNKAGVFRRVSAGQTARLITAETHDGATDLFAVDKDGIIDRLNSTDLKITAGTGSPEGVVTAPVGSVFYRTNGAAGTTMYVKSSGAGNTGWIAVPAVQVAVYTQTYATATRTHSNPTAVALTDNTTGAANTTVEAIPNPADAPATADALRDDIVANVLPAIRNDFADVVAQVNALVADVANAKQVLNGVIDDLQGSTIVQ